VHWYVLVLFISTHFKVNGYLKALLLVAAHVPDLPGDDGHATQNKGHGRSCEVRSGAASSGRLLSPTSHGVNCTEGANVDTYVGISDVDIESGGNS